jgi:muramoyltetrapeptide carboxypeptidase
MTYSLRSILFIFCSFQLLTAQTSEMKRPNFLKPGDTIAIVAPSGVIKNNAHIYEGATLAKTWGLNVIIGEHVFDKFHHYASSDKNRLADLQEALDNPSIKAIWCARGGYGAIRIIDDLDFSKFQETPKWIIGYSDITVFHSHLHNLGIETLHAMMPVNIEFPKEKRIESENTLRQALFGVLNSYSIPSSSYNIPGKNKGPLIGGNLTLLENLIGSNSSMDTSGKIIFFEEIGEHKYHIDRLLQGLKRNGYFDHCKGIIVGGMSHLKKNIPDYGIAIEELILDALPNKNIPIIFDFPAGHDPENKALYLGREIEVIVNHSNSSIKFLN